MFQDVAKIRTPFITVVINVDCRNSRLPTTGFQPGNIVRKLRSRFQQLGIAGKVQIIDDVDQQESGRRKIGHVPVEIVVPGFRFARLLQEASDNPYRRYQARKVAELSNLSCEAALENKDCRGARQKNACMDASRHGPSEQPHSLPQQLKGSGTTARITRTRADGAGRPPAQSAPAGV
jgi:hypothetical protein